MAIINSERATNGSAAAKPRRRTRVRRAGRRRLDARDRRILELERENRRLRASARALAEVQEKISLLLGIPFEREGQA